MRPAAKHYLFFAFLLVTLAALVALVLWQWHRARAEGAKTDPPGAAWHGHPTPGGHEPTHAAARWGSVPTALRTVCAAGAETRRAHGPPHSHATAAVVLAQSEAQNTQ